MDDIDERAATAATTAGAAAAAAADVATAAAATVADTATGAAIEAAEAVSRPGRPLRRLQRRGFPVNRELANRAENLVRDTARTAREVLDGTIPERVATRGLRIVKTRARQHDTVGDATYRVLELVHDGLGTAARTFDRMHEATQPPARPADSRGRRAPARPAEEEAEHEAAAKARPKAGGRRTTSA